MFTCLVVRVGESGPVVTSTEEGETLAVLQDAVGGHIETCARKDCGALTLDAYCNEDGIALDLPVNRLVDGAPILGPIVVTAANDAGETVSLEGVALLAAVKWVKSWPIVVRL